MERRFVQFELWQDCFQNCKFCYNKKTMHIYNSQRQFDNIKFVNDFLDTPEILDYNTFGLIGGEFFGGEIKSEEVLKQFLELIDRICSFENIKQILITSNLMYKDCSLLLNVCDKIQSKNKDLLICTSYDTIYRFNDTTLKYWEDNMRILSEKNIKTHVETILTADFIDKVLKKEFNIKDFEEKYNTRIDYCAPNSGFGFSDKYEMDKVLPNFFPTRNSMIKFLQYCVANKMIRAKSLFDMEKLNSQLLFQAVNGKFVRLEDRVKRNSLMPADDPRKSGYIDTEIPMWKDIELFRRLV